ncbi:MAG TPA: redoxin domain-containing protein [Candidatus Saccharicenans sp.]|nr:redoxin domain-containing protein [Candidatus Saccharicenans sp.]HRD02656.1 redoxin domain-containing protein [Candidatus Saccharicenans sp.]
MKKSFSLSLTLVLLASLLIVCSGRSSTSQLTISPDKPKPGDTVTFSYVPADKQFQSSNRFILYVYAFSKELPSVTPVNLTKSGKKWTGSYSVDKTVFGLAAKIKLDEKNEDTNKGQGYFFPLYNASGQILPGYKAGLALAYTSWGQLIGVEQNFKKALQLTEEDFQATPSIKKDFVNSYLRLLQSTKPEDLEKKAQAFLDEVSSLPELDDSALTTIYGYYAQLGNQEKAMAIYQQAQKNPKGDFFQVQALMQFRGIQDPKARLDFLARFKEEFPDSKYIDSIVSMMAQSLIQENKLEEAQSFLENNRGQAQPYYFYVIASQAAQNEAQIDLAIRAIDQGQSLAQEQLRQPDKFKPTYYTEEEWRQELEKNLLPMFLGLKGQLLIKRGQEGEALPLLKQAYELNQGKDAGVTADYVHALLANQDFAQATTVVEKYGQEEYINSELMGLLKQAYVGLHKSEEGWDKYQSEIQASAIKVMREDLAKKMINEAAAQFELKDLEGKTVKLNDYAGKVVVLDFWATWCGPCLSSFPGMKTLVEEYQKTPEVAFVFVNCWQDEDNKEQVVKDFLEKNQYPFYVLMDTTNKVTSDYGVSGIPTKFVLDSKGRIRFKVIGFEGDTEKMVQEVKIMIDLARGK